MENTPKLKTRTILGAKQDVWGIETPLKIPGARHHQRLGNRVDPSAAIRGHVESWNRDKVYGGIADEDVDPW